MPLRIDITVLLALLVCGSAVVAESCEIKVKGADGKPKCLPDNCAELYKGPNGNATHPDAWKITVVEGPPFVIVRDASDEPHRDTDKWEGFAIDFIKTLASTCRFSYELRLPNQADAAALATYDFSPKGPSRSYLGAQLDTYELNRTDIYFSAFYVTEERLGKSLMSQPLMNTPLFLVTRATPSNGESGISGWDRAFSVFHWKVWLAWALAVVVTGFTFWYLEAGIDGENFHDNRRANYASFKRNYAKSLWLSWSSSTGMAAHVPKSKIGQLYSGAWTLFCVILIASYTANLAATLSRVRVANAVESFQHMKLEGLTLCVKENTAYGRFLGGYSDLVHPAGKSGKGRITLHHVAGGVDGMMSALKNGECDAFTDMGAFMRYTVNVNNKCDETGFSGFVPETPLAVAQSEVEFGPQDNAIGVHQQHARALGNINAQIVRLRTDGTLDKMQKQYRLSKAGCTLAFDSGNQLTFDKLSGIFIALGIFACLLMGLRTFNYYARGHNADSLEKFLKAKFPSGSGWKPDVIVKQWENSWELRWKLHPLVLRFLTAIDRDEMHQWQANGQRIRDVDIVTWASKLAEESGQASLETDDSVLLHSPLAALSRQSIQVLGDRGKQLHDQFTGPAFKQLMMDQKDILRKALIRISSTVLENEVNRKLFAPHHRCSCCRALRTFFRRRKAVHAMHEEVQKYLRRQEAREGPLQKQQTHRPSHSAEAGNPIAAARQRIVGAASTKNAPTTAGQQEHI